MHEQRPYDLAEIDLFALGVILFEMRSGELPCDQAPVKNDGKYQHLANNDEDLFWQEVSKDKPAGFFSEEFQDLVAAMLSYNQVDRPRLVDILEHPWFEGKTPTKAEI